jgi:hypothetical protein
MPFAMSKDVCATRLPSSLSLATEIRRTRKYVAVGLLRIRTKYEQSWALGAAGAQMNSDAERTLEVVALLEQTLHTVPDCNCGGVVVRWFGCTGGDAEFVDRHVSLSWVPQ